MSIFIRLITVLNKANHTYYIYELGDHKSYKLSLLKNYQSFGIKELNYETPKFDISSPKFIYVMQKYYISFENTIKIPNYQIQLIITSLYYIVNK